MASSNYKFLRIYGYPVFCLLTNLTFFLINPYERTYNALRQFTTLDFVINMLVSVSYSVLVLESGILLQYLLKRRLPWERNMKTRFIVQLLLHIASILIIINLFFRIPFPEKFAFNQLLFRQSAITGMIFCLVITSVFAAEHLVYKLNDARLEAFKLNELAVQAQLDALKLQLDPHFLFNNLSTLTSLIEENPTLSVNYVVKLSSIYRYMLTNRTQNTISIGVELDFIKNILFLQQIRYGQAIRVNISPSVDSSQSEIAPLTLQLLIENAIKHNQFSNDSPLIIDIFIQDNSWLVVKNNRNPKRVQEPGAQLGLKNITQRYLLLSRSNPVINNTAEYFEVKIPLMNKNKKKNMLSILIIEDELPNAARLKKLLLQIDRQIEIVEQLQTVEASIEWLKTHEHPDVICMDIKLTDGLSFEIFDHVAIRSHVIFITAYDEYALKAFEVNGIDYLLKPLEEAQLEKSITRIKTLVNRASNPDLLEVIKKMQQREDIYRTRFLVSYRDMFIPIMVNNIAYFFSENKLVYLITNQSERYVVDQTLEELEQELNPRDFFRATRQYIVSAGSIQKIHQFFNGKLKLDLFPPAEEVVVSREKSIALRKWLS